MTNKIPKPAYQILFGFLMLVFTVVACNSKKEGDKKEPTPDTPTVQPAETLPPPVDDTPKKMEPIDTAKKKPVKDPS
jgi:hypothetical protein